MRDFPILHVVVSAVIHKQRESGADGTERERGREGEDGRQGQIAAFNRLPWGVAEGERVWEKDTYGGREREVMLKQTCIVGRWLSKKCSLAHWERLERAWSIQKRLSWHKRSPDGRIHTFCTHTYSEAPTSHTVQCTSFTTRFFFGEYKSLSCLPPTSVIFLYLFPAAPFPPFPYLKAESSWNKTNKYQITYRSSCICQRLSKSKPAHWGVCCGSWLEVIFSWTIHSTALGLQQIVLSIIDKSFYFYSFKGFFVL